MKTRNSYTLAAALSILLLAAGCGTMGDVLGTGSDTGTGTQTQTLHGTVDSIDQNSQSILFTNVTDYGSTVGNARSVRVYFDNRTTVDYQGKSYRPTDLERGDQIDVRYTQSGNNILAQSMTVTYDVAQGGGTGSTSNPGSYSSVRGTVQYVDTSRQTIQVNTGAYSNTLTTLAYDQYTTVTMNGRSYRAQDLQRGDTVDITTRNVGGTTLATQITVLTSGSTTGGTSTAAQGSVQGTVNSIDTNARTIQLTQALWGSGFTTGNRQTTVTVQYDDRSYVEYQGQSYPATNLERGDVVNVELRNMGNGNYTAGRITLMRNVRQ